MCKSTEWPSGTVSSLTHVIAFGWFVNLKEETSDKKFLIMAVLVANKLENSYGFHLPCPWTTTRGRLSHLWVELLLSAWVTVLAAVSALTLGGLAPFIAMFHIRAGSWPAFRVQHLESVQFNHFLNLLLKWDKTHLYLYFLGFRLRSRLLW